MCGIYCTNINISKDRIGKIMDSINFRGPDYQGYEKIDEISLAHNRLAIIDLSSNANQPFKYKHLYIVFNGEIYNFIELKKDLQLKGYNFNSSSDTEVVLAMYMQYGEKCVELFNGMFSFVIYDKLNRKLFFARDRFGQKPLYYSIVNKSIQFASQLKQIKIINDSNLNINAVNSYFKYKYIPEPLSIYNEIKKIPAASYGTYDLNSFKFEIKKYWDFTEKRSLNLDYEETKSKLSSLLESSVRYRMISDVPIGVFLSGGVDSSIITAYSQKNSPTPINTFCVKFLENKYDESVYAEKIAKYLGTNHTTIECQLNEIIELIKTFSFSFDEPFADPSSLPTLLLSKVTRKHVTVALSGDGGDESFLGYNRYDSLMKYSWFYKIPLKLRSFLSRFINIYGIKKLELLSSIIKEKNQEAFYHRLVQVIDQSYFNGKSSDILFDHNNYLINNEDLLSKISKFDIKTYLADDINVKVDRASMRFSLESRSPFLDYRVVEFASKMNINFIYKKNIKKYILKDILSDFIPNNLYDRPKSGFTIPLNNWFRNELKEWAMDHLSTNDLKLIPNLDVKKTEKMISNHMKGVLNKSNEIWKILVFVMWVKSDL